LAPNLANGGEIPNAMENLIPDINLFTSNGSSKKFGFISAGSDRFLDLSLTDPLLLGWTRPGKMLNPSFNAIGFHLANI
jgi:hypothetical protein